MASNVPVNLAVNTTVTAEEFRFRCCICGRSYKQKDSLTRHSHNHLNRQRHACLHCGQNFPRRDTMQRHLELHHKGRTRGFRACDRCRTSKIRCNSQRPCSKCIQADVECTYSAPSGNEHRFRSFVTPSDASRGDMPFEEGDSRMDEVNGPDSADSYQQEISSARDPMSINDLVGPSGDLASSSPTRGAYANPKPGTNVTGPVIMDNDASMILNMTAALPWSSTGFMSNEEFMANPALFSNDFSAHSGVENSFFYNDEDLNMILSSSLPELPVAERTTRANDALMDSSTELNLRSLRESLYIPSMPSADVPQTSLGFQGPQIGDAVTRIVEDTVAFAIREMTAPRPDMERWKINWKQFSTLIEKQLPSTNSAIMSKTGHLLEHFCYQFLSHFNTLWPLIRSASFSSTTTHPLLFLTMAIIGAISSGSGYGQLGLMLHEKLRISLLNSPVIYQHHELPFECLQAMLLTEITTLYFGPKSALFIAQQLGGLVVNHARRLGMFNERSLPVPRNGTAFEQWANRESIIRLAFGSFRAEVFVSYLLDVRPLVSPEEVNLYLPCSDELWMGNVKDQQDFIKTWRVSGLLYSDLVRIAIDGEENLPDLSVAHRDLILFGAQEAVWRFSNDPDLFSRMTGAQNLNISNPRDTSIENEFFNQPLKNPERLGLTLPRRDSFSSPEGSFTPSHNEEYRKMSSLQQEHERTLRFLREWKNSYIGNQSSTNLAGHRFNLMNSRLLYHLSFLRLRGNMPPIGLAGSELLSGQEHQREQAIERVWLWSQSVNSESALQHACAIWVLVSSEYTWKAGTRAKFNIACLLALHFASKVIWAYAGTHPTANGNILKIPKTSTKLLGHDLLVCRDNSHALMACFRTLLGLITQGWISWFPDAATTLMDAPFPPRRVAVKFELRED